MDANANNHRVALYGISVGVDGILVSTIAKTVELTQENKTRLLISLEALVINVVAALWVFSDIQHSNWKVLISKSIFIFTMILSPYAAFSMLKPEWYTWHGFAAICTVVTIIKAHNVLQFIFIWSCKRFAVAKKYLIEKVSVLMLRFQLSTDAAV